MSSERTPETNMKKLFGDFDWFRVIGPAVAGALLQLSCTGDLTGGLGPTASNAETGGGGSGTGGTAGEPPPYEPPVGMLRRLTRTQFRNAMSDLLGVNVDTSALDADSYHGEFATVGASTVVTSSRGVELYQTAVEAAVNDVFDDDARRTEFMGCTPVAADDACVRGFVEALGRRAWRRPLETAEIERLVGVARTADTELGSSVEGARWATVAMLASPNFLYRPELGVPADGANRLTGYEMASRLSFLLWNSIPDEQLLDDAENGLLSTAVGIRTAAERLLDAPAGREAVAAFAEEYMRLDRVTTQAKDPFLFPEYGSALQRGMVEDMRQVWTSVALDDDASILDVFSTTKVVANAELAELYGLDPAGLDSDTFKTFSLPEDGPRAGVLSKAGFLSQFANQVEGSPTLRGKFIREALMCKTVPTPPGNVALELPEPEESAPTTKRERLEMHRTEPTCAGCHGLMDPLGLPLESFDAVGRYRTTELGLTIDPSGEFDGVPVADSRELGTVLASSETVAGCITRKYYSYAMGHEERDVDETLVQELSDSFEASGHRLRSLILDVVANEAFATVAPQP